MKEKAHWRHGAAAATCAPSTTLTEDGKYNTFIKNYDRTKPIYRIAAGSNAQDYRWTEVLMDVAGRRRSGLSLHYYTLPTGNWRTKGSATNFGEDLWFSTLRQTLRMDDLIIKHAEIMDKAGASRGCGAPSAVGVCPLPSPAAAAASVLRVRRRSSSCGPNGCARSWSG